MAKIRTNTTEDGQITDQNPDAGGDHYLVGDHNRDVDYLLAKMNEWYKFSSTDTTEDFQILYGGVVSDGGSGTINVSAGASLGQDASGNLKLVEIPALTAIALPSGWNDGRQIWVIGQHKYVTTGTTRTHDETGESYNYTMIDSYLGSVTSDNLFVQADPVGSYVVWGSFNMNGTTFTDMNVRSMQYTPEQANRFGYISGNLAFNTTALPPTVSAGERNVIGNNIKLLADKNLALTDAFGGVSQVFANHTYTWQRVIIDKIGKYSWVPSFDTTSGVVDADTGISISLDGTDATMTVTSTAGVSNGMMGVIKGADISGIPFYLIGKIHSLVANTSFKIKTAKTGTVTGTISYDAYYRITTLHGSGSATGINTDADVQKYSPSPLFCAELQGYYLDQYGIPTSTASLAVYRIIGNFFINASSQTDTDIISYKSGFDKNDNIFKITTGALHTTPFATTDTQVYRFDVTRTDSRFWGNDYTVLDSAANGTMLQANRAGMMFPHMFANRSDAMIVGITKDCTLLTTPLNSILDKSVYDIDGIYSAVSHQANTSAAVDVVNGSTVRFQGSSAVGTPSGGAGSNSGVHMRMEVF